MVVRSTIYNKNKATVTNGFRCRISDRRLSTRKAANEATKLARAISSGRASTLMVTEQSLFVALHTCAYRATRKGRGRSALPGTRATWYRRWKVLRDYLVERNLGLVYTMIGRFQGKDLDGDDLRSEGLLALVRSVEGFNPWLGFRFSTYACNAIMRSLVHVAREAQKHRLRFPVEREDWRREAAWNGREAQVYDDGLGCILERNVAALTAREAMVLTWRFPMDGGFSRTLGEVGELIGISKERVRQIQRDALSKLREVLQPDPRLQ